MADLPPSGGSSDTPMTGDEIDQLQSALLAAIVRPDELEAIFSKAFAPIDLSDITVGPLTKSTLDVIKWADARGKIPQLIQAAREFNDGNEQLRQFGEYWTKRPRSGTSPLRSDGDPTEPARGRRLPPWTVIIGMILLVALLFALLPSLRMAALGLFNPPPVVTVAVPTSLPAIIPGPTSAPTQAPQIGSSPEPPMGLLAYGANTSMDPDTKQWDLFVYDFAAERSDDWTRTGSINETAPAWSHAGDRLAYVADPNDGPPQVWMMNRDQGDPHAVTAFNGTDEIWYVAWSADDQHLIITLDDGAQAMLVTVPSSGRDVATWKHLVGPAASHASVSDNGRMVYVTVGAAFLNLVLSTETGDLASVIAGAISDEDMPSISPDGKQVAYNVGTEVSRHIEVLTIDDRKRDRIPSISSDDSNPVWSPDGQSLAIMADEQAVWIVPRNDGTPEELDLANDVPLRSIWYLSWTGENRVPSTRPPMRID